MDDVKLFDTFRTFLPNCIDDISVAENLYKSGDTHDARVRLVNVIKRESERLRRYESAGRVAAQVEMLESAKISLLGKNRRETQARLFPEIGKLWKEAGQNVKIPEAILRVVNGVGRFAASVCRWTGHEDVAEPIDCMAKDAGAVQRIIRPFAVTIDVISNKNGTREATRRYLGDAVKEARAKTEWCISCARKAVERRIIQPGFEAVRKVASVSKTLFKMAADSVKGGVERMLNWLRS